MSTLQTTGAFARLLLPLLAVAACATPAPAEYQYGVPLDEVEFQLVSLTMGVYPDVSLATDPTNPFAEGGIDGDLRWQVTSGGLWVPTFYAWATWLAAEPTGEAQYYTALSLHEIYDDTLCEADDVYYVRGLAIDAYQAVLDHFPDGVTYDATGTTSWPVAPLAYDGILALGGEVQGGWVAVEAADGSTILMQSDAGATQ